MGLCQTFHLDLLLSALTLWLCSFLHWSIRRMSTHLTMWLLPLPHAQTLCYGQTMANTEVKKHHLGSDHGAPWLWSTQSNFFLWILKDGVGLTALVWHQTGNTLNTSMISMIFCFIFCFIATEKVALTKVRAVIRLENHVTADVASWRISRWIKYKNKEQLSDKRISL